MCGGFFSPPKIDSAPTPPPETPEKPDVVYNSYSTPSQDKLRRMMGTKQLQIPLAGTDTASINGSGATAGGLGT